MHSDVHCPDAVRKGTLTTIRGYALLAGVGLVLLGVVGVVGTLEFIPPADDILHLGAGGLLIYAGFGRIGERGSRVIVSVVGALYVVEGMIGPVRALLDELPITAYENGVDIAHVAFGLLSIFAAMLLPGRDVPQEVRH